MSGIDDLNNDPAEESTEFMYPDGGAGPVQSGNPSQPTSRPAGYESQTLGTGVIPDAEVASDLTGLGSEGSYDTRTTLGEWLSQQTQYNITPTPSGGDFGDGTIDTNSKHHKFVDPATIATVYSQEPNTRLADDQMLNTQQLPYGPGGNANTLLHNVESSGPTAGDYLNPGYYDSGMGTDVGRTSAVLKRNRFMPGDSWTSLGGQTGRAPEWSDAQKFHRDGSSAVVASTLGAYSPDLDGLSMTELQNVAEQLLLNAVGDKKTSFGDKNAATFNAGAGKPIPMGNATQLGRGRSNFNADLDFRAANAILPAITGDRSDTTNINGAMSTVDTVTEDLAANEGHIRTSYGALNNPLEPFRPGLPTSMIFLAAVGAVSLLIIGLIIAAVLDLLGTLISLIGGTLPPRNGLLPYPSYQVGLDGDPANLPYGQAFGNDDYGNTDFFSALGKWLNLPPLEAEYPIPWLTCLTATAWGTLEFFIGNSFSRVIIPQIMTNAAGYYVTVIRNAMRDMEQITEAFDGMGSGGAAGVIEGFFALIDAFTTSATYKFVITMMKIGDRILCGPGLFGNQDNDGRVLDSVMAENRPGPVLIQDLHTSPRRKSDKGRLSYSFTSLPQVYIRPREDFRRDTLGGLSMTRDTAPAFAEFTGEGNNFMMAGLGSVANNTQPTDILFDSNESIWVGDEGSPVPFLNRLSYVGPSGRISTTFREEMEMQLDSYYVPFYFHDLRTNEIMPLPAFVSNISDSFSPTWAESKGFGRADPVQIYGGTTRKIGFSFYMVSTSPDDFSALYHGINKLVSMVYPQWGGGQWINNSAGQSFRKPYSLIQTASPLIRIRLGELFASNRTPETVRRLFGANEAGFIMGKDDSENDMVPNHEAQEGDPAALQKVLGRKATLVQPNAFDLIQATGLLAMGGEIQPFMNFAGCNPEGQGGCLNMDGEPFLLPAGTEIHAPKGRYKFALWKGANYKLKRMKKCKFINPPVLKIVNYAAKGGKGKVALPKKGGYLKNDLYYICAPTEGTEQSARTTNGYARELLQLGDDEQGEVMGVAIPIKDVMGFGDVPPEPEIPGPNPLSPPEPPEPPLTDEAFFQDNLMVEAMRQSGGRGIAGVITSLDFDWNDAPWETDPSLGRAPQWVKVSLSFSPIHDEPLGLAPDGSLRAGAYPVGNMYEKIFGPRFGLPGQMSPKDRLSRLERANEAIAAAPAPPGSSETPEIE